MIPGILLGTRQDDHTVNEYAEREQGEVRIMGTAAATGANISAYNDVTSILHHRAIDWLRTVFILAGGGHNVTEKRRVTYLLPVMQHKCPFGPAPRLLSHHVQRYLIPLPLLEVSICLSLYVSELTPPQFDCLFSGCKFCTRQVLKCTNYDSVRGS